ncbi:MAG TPA: DUF1330 domain-containing protein [Bryobacteraceae bacterium]|nr:DUF1330 domain-containing protein [Bryobacteraceae bacterium]
MQETAVFVVIEVVSVKVPDGLNVYQERASKLILPLGGTAIAVGAKPIDDELGFSTLVIQRWPSEGAFRNWLDSEAYQPLNEIRRASATMRVAIVPVSAGLDL